MAKAATVVHEVYNKSKEIVFYPNSHRYRMSGMKSYLTSVTAITGIIDKSRPLMIWASRLTADYLRDWIANNKLEEEALLGAVSEAVDLYNKKRDEAAGFGTQVHDFAERFAIAKLGNGKMPELTDDMPIEVINGINAFLDWVTENNVEFLETEKLIYSDNHGFVGLCDVVANVNGHKMMCDYKTSKAMYSPMFYQVAAYRAAYNEEMRAIGGLPVVGSMILHFNKENGELDTRKFTNEEHEEHFETFLACMKVKMSEKKNSKY